MNDYKTENELVKKFQRFISPEIPALEVRHAFNCHDLGRWWADGLKKRLWRESGVYLFFNDEDVVDYVGMTLATYEKRILLSHGDCIRDGLKIDYAAIVVFSPEYSFLAAALEVYLIANLKPEGNRNYKDLYFPPLSTRVINP